MIRVVRIIEHTFDSSEAAERSMSRWSMQGTGSRVYPTETIRWSQLPIDFLAPKSEGGTL